MVSFFFFLFLLSPPSSVSWVPHCLFPRVPMTCAQTGTCSAFLSLYIFHSPRPWLIAIQQTTLFRTSSFMKGYFRWRDFCVLTTSLTHPRCHSFYHRSLNRCRWVATMCQTVLFYSSTGEILDRWLLNSETHLGMSFHKYSLSDFGFPGAWLGTKG